MLGFLHARIRRIPAGIYSWNYVCGWVGLLVCPLLSPHPPPVLSVYLLILLLISPSLSSLDEGSSRTCVGAVPRDLLLNDIMSGIRWLLLHSNTVCCTILSVERCSLGNTSLHRDEMTPPLQEYSSVLYYTILYNTKCFAQSQQYQLHVEVILIWLIDKLEDSLVMNFRNQNIALKGVV